MTEAAAPDEAPRPDPLAIVTLSRRADFLRAAAARRQGTASLLLQARARGDGSGAIRFGLTASKKIGNAVARNRARRRLRAAARALLPALGRAGWDYVIVARPQATISVPWNNLIADLARALGSVHAPRAPRSPGEDSDSRRRKTAGENPGRENVGRAGNER